MKPSLSAAALTVLASLSSLCVAWAADDLPAQFVHPPDDARPGVYWYFMDGNQTETGMTRDLESMKKAGLGHVLFLDVNLGLKKGPVEFMGAQWQEDFVHAVHETERLGMQLMLGSGPGWAGSGGPWIKPQDSMQDLVGAPVDVTGPAEFGQVLPLADPPPPTFGANSVPEPFRGLRQAWQGEVAVLAFPTPAGAARTSDIREKALYYRGSFSSRWKGTGPSIPSQASYPGVPDGQTVPANRVIDLTSRMKPDGTLNWTVPPGKWTVVRFVSRNNGAITRPAPQAGLGFEVDKLDAGALDRHYADYVGLLVKKVGRRPSGNGWTMLHIDSWEMGAQNWTPRFREDFKARRGYDPLPFYPAYLGYVVDSPEATARFLWDLRQTASELVVQNHAEHLQELGRRDGFTLSIEPYDLTPCNDFDLGAVADLPMAEFWGLGLDTTFSVQEAASVGHVMGRPVIGSEAFTSGHDEAWQLYPGSMKNEGDWAFASGINRFTFHTFAHKPDEDRPGMQMWQYGVHWDRGQTWWPMADAYHRYITRCSEVLRQGRTVADILYLMPEGAPNVFQPPASAFDAPRPKKGAPRLPDRKGHNFDGCSSGALIRLAGVRDGSIVFPSGASYRVLVLPDSPTMTPELVNKLEALVKAGATVMGNPPGKSPSFSGYPACDSLVAAQAVKLWGSLAVPTARTVRPYGQGRVVWGGPVPPPGAGRLYPDYAQTAALLEEEGVPPDFSSPGALRYTHRTTPAREIYFVANTTDQPLQAAATFRIAGRKPEFWDAVTGTMRPLPEFTTAGGLTTVPLQFAPCESCFVVFPVAAEPMAGAEKAGVNFPALATLATLAGPWDVAFDTTMGGPAQVRFDQLDDWSVRPEPGIKYFSGIATYRKTFEVAASSALPRYLDLGKVEVMARVKVNGQDCGVAWTAPWRVDISGSIKRGANTIEVEVANLWPNRMIGDAAEKDQPPFARSTYRPYKADHPLLPSGLLGPVTLEGVAGSSDH